MNKIIDGKIISEKIMDDLKLKVQEANAQGIYPELAVILVGDDPASQVYVKNKQLACEKLGVKSKTIKLESTIEQKELEKTINELNQDKNITGILVQLPLPKHINEEEVLSKIDARKDVDGFHVINSGKLLRGIKCIKPCTPKGVMTMLEYMNINPEGKNAVIIGRSNLVGKPLALMMLAKNATVTVCHSKTQNLKEITKNADILVVAIGKANFVTKDMIKQGAIVIDVGISRIDGKLYGDVNFDDVYDSVSLITPVPGGVGKMTICTLMQNTLQAAIDIKNHE
ncbi:MAG: bifunctional methylenetetrahydrofolate dehydrogenase/methenyltetrahydrofolate cyclohydrolase FolD [Christensenellaceae bacterium]|nr:bifunctional methylenetetrahydrofolate dehydrogenase/methenyltetrahydrofolate cyclohydrolase FolD [Christensenellaceae bacterium]